MSNLQPSCQSCAQLQGLHYGSRHTLSALAPPEFPTEPEHQARRLSESSAQQLSLTSSTGFRWGAAVL